LKSNFKDSERNSYLGPNCATCILDVSAKYLQLAYNSNKSGSSTDQLKDMQKLITELSTKFCPEDSPNEIATNLFILAAKLGNSKDPWKQIRDLSNKIGLELLPIAQENINRIEDTKKKLFAAIEWSIVGNNIDFGTAGHDAQLGYNELLKIHQIVKKEGFKINHFNQLWEDIHQHKKCLYILDNAGEIVFDKMVIEQLIAEGIKVKAVVKGGPVSNDAVMDDAIAIGLDKICPVITTGSSDLGFVPYKNSKIFLIELNTSSLVIAKGQANWECSYAYQDQLSPSTKFYNIFKIKCDIHAQLFGFPIQSNIIYNIKHNDFKNGKLYSK
jgi:damage-control phosphatase, subfamily I